MEYIVLDLEWNQSNTGKEDAVEKLPFEIIEIGAIKLNKERVMVSEFNELINPQVYHEMQDHQQTDPYSDAGAGAWETIPGGRRRFCQMVRTGGVSVLYLGHAGSDGVTAEYGIL